MTAAPAIEIASGRKMKVFARDRRVISIDADLATTSGLEAGVAAVDQRRALNVGVAEANMMGIGEAFAALGYQTWISTFCPFFPAARLTISFRTVCWTLAPATPF